MKERFLNRIGVNKEKKGKLCLLIPIMKSSIKSNRGISLSRDAPFSWLCSVCSTSVSMHALRAGCDIAEVLFNTRFLQFQSTHPGRGATSTTFQPDFLLAGFNPRTPGGVRQYKKERAESQGNMWYVLRTYWCGFPLNKLSDFSFKLSS